MKFPNGAFHLEAFWKNNDFIFLEVAIRQGGGEIVNTIERAIGLNLADAHIKCQFGIKPIIPKSKYDYFGWLSVPRPDNLKVDKFVKNIIVPKRPKSLFLEKIPKIGEKVNANFINYSNTLGSFAFVGDNRENLFNDINEFAKAYKVEY